MWFGRAEEGGRRRRKKLAEQEEKIADYPASKKKPGGLPRIDLKGSVMGVLDQ